MPMRTSIDTQLSFRHTVWNGRSYGSETDVRSCSLSSLLPPSQWCCGTGLIFINVTETEPSLLNMQGFGPSFSPCCRWPSRRDVIGEKERGRVGHGYPL